MKNEREIRKLLLQSKEAFIAIADTFDILITSIDDSVAMSKDDVIWITATDAALVMGVTVPTVKRMGNKGLITFRETGNGTVFPRREYRLSSLKKYMKNEDAYLDFAKRFNN